MLNIKALFNRGYKLEQAGVIDFKLVKDDKTIIDFDIEQESTETTLENVYEFLLRELNYHIREIEEESKDYFYDEMSEEEINYIKTSFYRELLDIRDWLV